MKQQRIDRNFKTVASHRWKIAAALLALGTSASAAPSSGGAPFSLKSAGSFFVGGRSVTRSASDIGIYGGGTLTVDQMYVQYMIPAAAPHPAVVLIHGGTLSGASFETTPDGRMGWYEYFARNGYPTYVVDQVGRGRSGFDHAIFNEVLNGAAAPTSQPKARRVADEVAWVRFRFGPRAGVPFKDGQFPVNAAPMFSKQSVPDLSSSPPTADDPNYPALIELSKKVKNTVLIGHSQSGQFPFEVALRDSSNLKALVAIEPGGCNARVYTDAQIQKLTQLPILVVFGDHLDTPQEYGSSWLPYYDDCRAFVGRVNAAGGQAHLLHTVDLGIRGNSHMMMQDKNNLQIADLIINWIKLQR